MNFSRMGRRGQDKLNTYVPSRLLNKIQHSIQWWGVMGTARRLEVNRATVNRIECGEAVRKVTVARIRAVLNR